MSILGGAGANAAPLWAMPYEDAAQLFATDVRVGVIVYYYDGVEKQILPAFYSWQSNRLWKRVVWARVLSRCDKFTAQGCDQGKLTSARACGAQRNASSWAQIGKCWTTTGGSGELLSCIRAIRCA